jgi:hypothetical protein
MDMPPLPLVEDRATAVGRVMVAALVRVVAMVGAKAVATAVVTVGAMVEATAAPSSRK